MSNSGHEGTRIRRDLGSVGFRLWRRFGYCRTGHNHGSANHDYDSSYYDCGTDNDHGSANHDYSHGCSNRHASPPTNRHANPPTNRHSDSNASANTYADPYSSTSTYAAPYSSANTYAAPYSSTSTYANHGERVRCRWECSRECGVLFGVLVVFS